MKRPRYKIVPESALTNAMDQEIRDLLCNCFSGDADAFSETRYWHGSAPSFSVIAMTDSKRMVGHIGVVVRTIQVDERPLTVAGIQNFAIHPDARGGKAGPMLMEQAMDEARNRSIEFGLLFCVPALGPYYERLNWQTIDTKPRMDYGGQTNIPIPGKNICMIRCLAESRFPPGEIHLGGPDW